MEISKNSFVIRTIEEWFNQAPPRSGKRHWKDGRSAKECARAWFDNDSSPSVPAELQALLDSHPDLAGARVESATPEHRVYFDQHGGEPRNSDMVALSTHPGGRIAISIEAKADESFDKLVSSIRRSAATSIANDENTNRIKRIQDLARALLPSWRAELPHLGELRYQLLTGVAGALRYAVASEASHAVFVVHEFVHQGLSHEKLAKNAADLDRFVARITNGRSNHPQAGRMIGPIHVRGAPLFDADKCPALYIGKAHREVPRPAEAK